MQRRQGFYNDKRFRYFNFFLFTHLPQRYTCESCYHLAFINFDKKSTQPNKSKLTTIIFRESFITNVSDYTILNPAWPIWIFVLENYQLTSDSKKVFDFFVCVCDKHFSKLPLIRFCSFRITMLYHPQKKTFEFCRGYLASCFVGISSTCAFC